MTSAVGANPENYGYDLTGNRNANGFVPGPNNRIQSDGIWTYGYDFEGNITSKAMLAGSESWSYQYDHENKLIVAEQFVGGVPTASVVYEYDALGRRVSLTSPTAFERFAYDGRDVVLDLDTVNVTARRAFGSRVDEVAVRIDPVSGNENWYLTDYQGSVTLIADPAGAILGSVTYDSFGQILVDSTGAARDRYKYTGREFEPVTGQQYNWARYYLPDIGRWSSEDPKGFAGLPTEAEWEYACRATTTTRYYSGEELQHLRGVANLGDLSFKRMIKFTTVKTVPRNDGFAYTAPVGQFKPNQFGLYDMIGNVGEWCKDYYGPYKDMPAVDPLRSKTHDGTFGKHRVWRGGDFGLGEVAARVSNRSHELTAGGDCSNSVGFRVLIRLEK